MVNIEKCKCVKIYKLKYLDENLFLSVFKSTQFIKKKGKSLRIRKQLGKSHGRLRSKFIITEGKYKKDPIVILQRYAVDFL